LNCILLHLHYQDLWPEFWSYLKYIDADLYVTVHSVNTEWYEEIKSNATDVFVIENRGEDFGGFLYALNQIKNKEYLTITKLHGKKSLYYGLQYGENWRKSLYLPIIKSPETFDGLCAKFKADRTILVAGSGSNLKTEYNNEYRFLRKKNLDSLLITHEIPNTVHVAGSMYVFSKEYLRCFFKGKEMEVFNQMELGYSDMLTIGHHFEILICNCETFCGRLLLI